MASVPGYAGPMGSPIFGTPQAPQGLLGLSPQIAPSDMRRKRQIQGIADTLTQLGIGLMGQGPSTTPQNPLQGLAQGLQGANQMMGQRQDQNMQEDRLGMQQAQFGMQQQQFQAEQKRQQEQDAFEQARRAQMEKLIAGLPPEQQAAARADPDTFFKSYAEAMFPKAQGPQSSLAKLASDLKAGLITQPEYDAAVRKETYIAPQTPPTPPQDPETIRLLQAAGIDPKSPEGQAIIRNKLAGSNGINFTDAQGNKLTIGGPAGGKEPNATESQNAKQGSLIKLGLDSIRSVNMANISPAKMAAVGVARTVGGSDIGNLAQSYGLNDDEQKFVAGRAAISEAVTAAITGAAYAPEQLRNYQNVFVPTPGEPPEVTAQKLYRSAIFLQQLDSLSGGARIDTLGQDVITKAAEMAKAVPVPGGDQTASPDKEALKKKYGLE